MSNSFASALAGGVVACCVVLPLGFLVGKNTQALPSRINQQPDVRMSGVLTSSGSDPQTLVIRSEPNGVAYLAKDGLIYKVNLATMRVIDYVEMSTYKAPYATQQRHTRENKEYADKVNAIQKAKAAAETKEWNAAFLRERARQNPRP